MPGELRGQADPTARSRHEPAQGADRTARCVPSPDRRAAPLRGSYPTPGTISSACSLGSRPALRLFGPRQPPSVLSAKCFQPVPPASPAPPPLVPTALRGRGGHATLWGWGISPPKRGPPRLFPSCRGGWRRPRGWLLRESGPDVTQSPAVPVACNLHHGRAAGRLRPEAGRRSPSGGSGGLRPGVPGGRVLRLGTWRCRGRSREVPETGS